MIRLVYVLFGDTPKEVVKTYDEVLEMIANIENGVVLQVCKV